MLRGAVALLIALVVATGPVDAAPRHAGGPTGAVPASCVQYVPGQFGMAVSPDGALTVSLTAWTFADGQGGHHGFEYRAWGPHTVASRAGGELARWGGFSVPPVDAVVFCADGPGWRPLLA